MSEPRCIEAGASVSCGGKIQMIKFEYDSNYYYSYNRKYSIPDDWTEEQVREFQARKTIELREEIEPLVQAEVEALEAERDRLR